MAPITKKTSSSSAGKSGTGNFAKNITSKGGPGFVTTKSSFGKNSSSLGKNSSTFGKNSSTFGKNSSTLGSVNKSSSLGKGSTYIGKSSTSSIGKTTSSIGKTSSGISKNNSSISKNSYTLISKNDTYSKNISKTVPLSSNSKSINLLPSLSPPKSSPSQASTSFANLNNFKPKSEKQTTFGIIWLPTKKRNKNKDHTYNSYNYDGSKERSPSMYNIMSGDSNVGNQPYKIKEEDASLLSHEKTKPAVAAAAVSGTSLQETTQNSKEEEKNELLKNNREESKEAGGDAENQQEDKKEQNINDDYYDKACNAIDKSPDGKWEKDKLGDKVDSVYLRPPPPHKARSTASTNEDEEDCAFKCLYYTLQCCDCVLM